MKKQQLHHILMHIGQNTSISNEPAVAGLLREWPGLRSDSKLFLGSHTRSADLPRFFGPRLA